MDDLLVAEFSTDGLFATELVFAAKLSTGNFCVAEFSTG